jgi:hypothetical protein
MSPGTMSAEPKAQLIECRKIWDHAPHNAFTDLVRFHDGWLCVFREGGSHVARQGSIRVIQSRDGEKWRSCALIRDELGDLRDPKLSLAPGGRLMLLAAIALPQPNSLKHLSVVSFSTDARHWSKPVPVGDPNIWLWRVTWLKGASYGLGYSTDGSQFVRLYRSQDGRNFKTVVPRLLDNKDKLGQPNESALVFLPDETALCLLRRDGHPGTALLGQSDPPYKEWTWRDTGLRVGGPDMI